MNTEDVDFYCRLLSRIKEDPEFFCKHLIKIKNKEGRFVPFELNPVQKKVLSAFLRQYREKRTVRIIVAKSRQQGISTLCCALCLWYSIVRFADGGLKGIIVAQREIDLRRKVIPKLLSMSNSLFQSLPFVKNKTPKDSAGLTLNLGDIDSRIDGAWARTEGENRGDTYQFAFLTEVDSYENWNDFWAGLFPSFPENKCVLLVESTCKGRNAIWQLYQKKSKADFELVFLPWFEQPEYATEGDDKPDLTPEQQLIQKKYNLTDAQMRWYAIKEEQLGSSLVMKWEYPSSLEDCFVIENDCTFFGFDLIETAAHRPVRNDNMPTILGIDPSKTHDNTAMVWRKGTSVIRILNLPPLGGTAPLVRKIVRELELYPADKIFVDAAGSSIAEYLYKDHGIYCRAVNFGEAADKRDLYMNKRAEMYARAARWLERYNGSIPNDPEFKKQLREIKYIPGKPRLQLMDKSLLPKSPDIADAFVLTFAGSLEDWSALPSFSIEMKMKRDPAEFNVFPGDFKSFAP